MAKLESLGEHQRKRFCYSLVNEIESELCGDMIKPKAKYMVESLRTFLTEDNNFYGLELLDSTITGELSQEQFNFITNKIKNTKAEWNSIDCQMKSLTSLKQEPVLDYFYMEVEKIEKEEPKSSDHTFSMTYKEETKTTSENWLEQGYDKYKGILPDSNAKKKPVENGYVKTPREGPHITSQVSVQLDSEKLYQKQLRKLEKKSEKLKNKDYNGDYSHYNNSAADYGISKTESLTKLARSAAAFTQQQYPHVHDSQKDVHVKMMICGQPTNVPNDALKKSTQTYDEITIPSRKSTEKINFVPKIKVSTMDKIGKMVFRDIESFNHIQSEVYPVAYHTNENMLICAPTGAGKTNIALLTIVQQIKNFVEHDVVRLEKFKIVYVCPMKALASEMTENFSKKLLPLGIQVKELTGDMQLSRKEIVETQMLVTTPEKWDVITRKGSNDGELTSLLKLLILDEVHLLNSDRGPVIEALVARTLRQVVNSQNMIRIVGLSATLPNYIDVAHFLRVNPEIGLFYFDLRYRSVPLTQTFIGIKSTKQIQTNIDTDETCFTKVVDFLRGGHQVMVFVHARNQTNKTANFLKETAGKRNLLHLFEPDKNFKAKKAVWNVKNKSLESLLPFGLGVHHAGMLRKDRNEVEKCFLQGAIKVLVCTATLAWGVNLPAHAVIIKGTKLYDSKKSAFVDLDILDVMQIFGRAGRPQFDTSGTGIIITTSDKMNFYLSAMTNQIPIESKLLNALTDNLNAEIVLGSISNIQEAVEWMTFTYLYRRMRMNPQVYSLQYADLEEDPDLRGAMLSYAHKAATLLDKAHMIRYDPKNGDLMATNLGRTASYYYINFDTMEIFNDMMNPTMTEAEIIEMMCLASEFQQIQVRQEELEDLDYLMDNYCELNVPGGPENVCGKVNILMQTYLSRGYIKSLSLASDMEYITQSAARIARSLFDIAIHQNKAILAGRCLLVAHMFEQQIWPFQSPLRQFKYIEGPVIQNIELSRLNIDRLREMDEKQIGSMIRIQKLLLKGVIRVKLSVKPNFKWSNTYHGKASENFWIWVEDPDTDCIYHSEMCTITKATCIKEEALELVFTIPLIEPRPSQYLLRISSDRWIRAPTGSGKTIAAEICMFRLFNMSPQLKIVYIAPLKALVRERVDDWRKKFGGHLNKNVVEITGDVTPSPHVIDAADIIITTPEKWDGMSRGWQNRNFIREVGLMVIDEIHLLGEDRGPVLEVIVSRTNFISDRTGRKLRIVGLSTAMANAKDLATWLGIGEMGLYNFRPSVRPVPLEVHIAGFPGKHYCPRMISMNRPTYQAIRQHAPDSPALVFCSSRKQTRLTAFDLITYLVTDTAPKQWLHCDEDTIALLISNIVDVDLKQFLAFGIGIHHAGLQERDRKTVEELFVNQKIQVLIATATLAWGVNFPAHLVVIKVRHNEDKINMQLVKILSFNLNGVMYDSPHLKVNLLLQMYLNDLELPNQEYTVDLKSVLDQALRILQAMIDIAAYSGWLSCTIRIIFLMQMMIQGRWTFEPDVLTIPGVTKPTLPTLFKELTRNQSLRNCSADSLAGIKCASMRHSTILKEAFINVFGTNKAAEIMKHVFSIPWLENNIVVTEIETNEKKQLNEDVYKLLPDTEYEISLSLFRKGSGDKSVLHSPRFPKKKDEGWFAVLGDSDELLCIKRFNVNNRTTVSLKFSTPPRLGTYVYKLYIMSDSYIGLDQQFEIPIQVKQ
ncbi:sec63 domain-containing [Holotrichia oblita]|uniref:Sec63 domain-containing n=1 Tax=Holotrichia oblita TaxID=644536 RepID=A0ACB9T9B8_HOLOL|nr:sec63 domain-containing [Holotrichia oblita]